MKKELLTTIVCAFTLLFFSCKPNTQKADINSKDAKIITLSSIEESFQDTAYFKEPQVVVLETLDNSLLTEIEKISMDDNILFIFDRQLHNIFMFDITGKYISKIDCKGEGPGEYAQINDFTIDPVKKQIILICTPYKRMYFTYNGVFIKEETHPTYYSELTTDGDYIYFERTGEGVEDYQLYILDIKTGKIQERLKPIGIKNYCHVNGNSLNRGKDILYVRRYDNSIYELANGEITKKYHVDFKKHSFPDWLITEEKSEVVFPECDTHEYVFSMSNVIRNDNCMMFYTNRGVFLYDKKNDALTGYKKILNSKLDPFNQDPFTYYFALGNTNKIVCSIEDPSYIKRAADKMVKEPTDKMKEVMNTYPKFVEEVIRIGSKMTDDNNPILFIYEFKD